MIVPVHIVGYSNMMNSINGNTQAQTVYFQSVPEKKPVEKRKPMMFSLADVPLLTVAAISSKPKTLSAFAKSFARLPIAVMGLAIPGSIAAKVTSKVLDNRAKEGKNTEPVLAMAGFGALWYGLYKAGAAGVSALVSKIPESYKKQAGEGLKDLSKAIDASSANKKVYEPIANKVGKVLKAHPQIWKPAMVAASIAAVAICFLPSIKRNRQAEKELQQQRQIEHYIQTQQAQELAQLKELQSVFASKQ
ncbi:hypothetical protein IKQ26_01615 [bacterium]|nr:hypothetical protein [bacterium]